MCLWLPLELMWLIRSSMDVCVPGFHVVLLWGCNPRKHVDNWMTCLCQSIDSVQEAPLCLHLSVCISTLLALIPNFFLFSSLPQMSWNGSEQLEKAMEEVLDDDDEVKVEKSSVEKMEKHMDPERQVLEPQPAGIDLNFSGPFTVQSLYLFAGSYLPVSCFFIHPIMHQNWNITYIVHKCSFQLAKSSKELNISWILLVFHNIW